MVISVISLWKNVINKCYLLYQRMLLLYALFNHPRRYSRLSGSRKLSSRIILTGQFYKYLGVQAVGLTVQLNK